MRVITQNMEKYLSITVGKHKFIDSLQFTSQTLDILVKTLEVDEFKYVREAFPIAHEFELIKRKGVYPYVYMDSFARFDESDSPCSDTEYTHATQVWTAFQCQSMADYHVIYLKCDVLPLTDLLEKFLATCYSFNAVHYYTAPGLAEDAALRITHVSVELITDIDMHHYIENSIRSGFSMITTRYARINARTLPAYDASLPNVNLIYLDANNLYGWAMYQPLPTHGFRILQLDEIEALTVEVGELPDDAEDGYIFEVDFSYPQHLHDTHDDYPLAPVPLEICRDMYSHSQQAVFPQTAHQRKLTPNLGDKVR